VTSATGDADIAEGVLDELTLLASRAADAIMRDVAETLPVELVTGDNPLGITVGLASTPPGGAEVRELLEAAVRELYAAKPNGGGRRSTR
jgi:PleD family two-component response regulator